jgi:hypothetical protein
MEIKRSGSQPSASSFAGLRRDKKDLPNILPAQFALSGLTPGQIYNVKVSAVGAAGAIDYSGPASLMVI